MLAEEGLAACRFNTSTVEVHRIVKSDSFKFSRCLFVEIERIVRCDGFGFSNCTIAETIRDGEDG